MSDRYPSVSVTVATYNSDIRRTKATIKSIALQQDVDIEIIVSDDGSTENHFTELEEYMSSLGVEKYQLLAHETNQGTVWNVYDAISHATYSYVKTLSAGDFLYDETTLVRWVSFLEETDAKLSFCNAVGYHHNLIGPEAVQIPAKPQMTFPYTPDADGKLPIEMQRLWYLWMNDMASGATLLVDRDTFLRYLGKIRGRVKYAEDFCLRLAVADGVGLVHFPENGIWYECEVGVSNTLDDKHRKMIEDDLIAANHVLAEDEEIISKLPNRYKKTFLAYGAMPMGRYRLYKLLLDPRRIQDVKRQASEPRDTDIDILMKETFLWKNLC